MPHFVAKDVHTSGLRSVVPPKFTYTFCERDMGASCGDDDDNAVDLDPWSAAIEPSGRPVCGGIVWDPRTVVTVVHAIMGPTQVEWHASDCDVVEYVEYRFTATDIIDPGREGVYVHKRFFEATSISGSLCAGPPPPRCLISWICPGTVPRRWFSTMLPRGP